MIHAVCDGRADGVFGDVAADPVVVGGLATRRVTFQCPAAGFHHVRGLPGAQHHLADTAHRLGIAANHRDCPHIVQHIFCRNGGRSDPAFGKREVLRDPGLRWWHTISMSRCSSRVFTVCGRVGLVELGSTFGCAATVMMSGACRRRRPRCGRRESNVRRSRRWCPRRIRSH